jgi:hypothetical protein
MTYTEKPNLAQCEWCGYVCNWDDVERGRDPFSGEIITFCIECNEGEPFVSYLSDRNTQ